jgi:hypothetical protein
MSQVSISFGDNVRVRDTPVTRARSLADLTGVVHGHTKPSVTQVEVIGDLLSDYAIAVHFERLGASLWFARELLEFMDHGSGTVITIGMHKLVRQMDGSWLEEKTGRTFKDPAMAHSGYRRFIKPSRPWWKFW